MTEREIEFQRVLRFHYERRNGAVFFDFPFSLISFEMCGGLLCL